MNEPGIQAYLQDWFANLELSLWEVLFIAYAITGVFRLMLDAPFLYNLWSNFDEHLREKIGSLKVEQMHMSSFRTLRLTYFISGCLMVFLLWPVANPDANKREEK